MHPHNIVWMQISAFKRCWRGRLCDRKRSELPLVLQQNAFFKIPRSNIPTVRLSLTVAIITMFTTPLKTHSAVKISRRFKSDCMTRNIIIATPCGNQASINNRPGFVWLVIPLPAKYNEITLGISAVDGAKATATALTFSFFMALNQGTMAYFRA